MDIFLFHVLHIPYIAKLSEYSLFQSANFFLLANYHKSHKTVIHGKTTVKKLMAQDQGAATIPVAARNFKDFERAVRKYNVDFAVMREKGKGKEARASLPLRAAQEGTKNRRAPIRERPICR